MKKWLSLLLALAMMLALLVGCGRDKNDNQPAQDSPEAQETQPVQDAQDTQQVVIPEVNEQGDNVVSFDDVPSGSGVSQGDSASSGSESPVTGGESSQSGNTTNNEDAEWSPAV